MLKADTFFIYNLVGQDSWGIARGLDFIIFIWLWQERKVPGGAAAAGIDKNNIVSILNVMLSSLFLFLYISSS